MSQPKIETQTKLIDAAGEIFSQKGFFKASVREIARLAGLNGAALINYHFGDKQGLYREVLRYSFSKAKERFGKDVFNPLASAEERLFKYVHLRLVRFKSSGRPSWFDKLLTREMYEPTDIFEEVIRETVLPNAVALRRIVQELLGRDELDRDVIYCCLSIIGQCQHHHFARRQIKILYPTLTYTPDDLKLLAEHITRFSLAGINAIKNAHTVALAVENTHE